MKRPVWLFSMDSEQFSAAPMTTGGLKAYYQRYGQRAADTDIELVHFLQRENIPAWRDHWRDTLLPRARAALQAGQVPVAGFSFYTWNAAEFLELVRFLRESLPELMIVAGGPHVQQAEDYIPCDPIDAVVLGEGEETFRALLDASDRSQWAGIDGLAYLDAAGGLSRTPARARIDDLDLLPSAFEVLELHGEDGQLLYESMAYETSRGCPFKCSFCEWGTGDIGGKMRQFSLERVKRDWQYAIDAGIKNIWLADSNFGALKHDLEKARFIIDLKQRTGLPTTFATSWSKKHSPRVQEIVLLLNQHGLLPHYQLALQTLTPLALELSNRQNMAANKFEPIAKAMAEQGVPIAAELIWGLPGDNLDSFEAGLDRLLGIFPHINIFGYTLLPGTEFYERRFEYKIDTIPVAGYGKAKGEYVVGCHTFPREEGMEGYFLISSHLILTKGALMAFTARFLAVDRRIPISALLRASLRALLDEFRNDFESADIRDPLSIYEHRAAIYLDFLQQRERSYRVIRRTVEQWLIDHGAGAELIRETLAVLEIDAAICPRQGSRHLDRASFDFDARAVLASLEAMERPAAELFAPRQQMLEFSHPGGAGEILKDPDGGHWMRGELLEASTQHYHPEVLARD